jgi:4-hydroxyphenylpyruvate dioxygenase
MRQRGAEFLSIPDNYYDNLRKNLTKVDYKVTEDL